MVSFFCRCYPDTEYRDNFNVTVQLETPGDDLPGDTTVGSPPPVVDTFESNNTKEQAFSIVTGKSYSSYIFTPDDGDYYQFTTGGTAGTMNIGLTVPSGKDFDFVVYEGYEAAQPFVTALRDMLQQPEYVEFAVQANTTYYIAVYGATVNSVREYDNKRSYVLSVSLIPGSTTADTWLPVTLATTTAPWDSSQWTSGTSVWVDKPAGSDNEDKAIVADIEAYWANQGLYLRNEIAAGNTWATDRYYYGRCWVEALNNS